MFIHFGKAIFDFSIVLAEGPTFMRNGIVLLLVIVWLFIPDGALVVGGYRINGVPCINVFDICRVGGGPVGGWA